VGLLRPSPSPSQGCGYERWSVSFEERPLTAHASAGGGELLLGKETVALVTGAAGGITSAVVADLAAASGGTFYLVDIAAAPRPSDPKIALLRSGRDALKRALIAEAKERGEKPTPVQVDRQVLAVEREEAALAAVEAVDAAGGKAYWRSVNLLDGPGLAGVVDEIRARHGRIDLLVHAGGLEISRRLPDKEAAEFDLVFDVKADGFFSILKAAGTMPLGAAVVFSSVAGRFGNAGQADYSAANDLLCKTISWLRAARPGTKAVALDWTAWGGIGMATRGSIPKIMEAAGIDMLPPEAGIPTVRRELLAAGPGDEIVVAGRLGTMGAELEPDGGLDAGAAARHLASLPRPLVAVGTPLAWTLHGGLEVRTTLDPGVQPFLFDHAMEGTPLLPGVMGTEAFAELASFAAPGRSVLSVEGESFEKAFKFFRMQPQTLHLGCRASRAPSGEVVVAATLSSESRPNPELPPQRKVHFRASVRMGSERPKGFRVDFRRPDPAAHSIGRDAVYEVYFHGPAYRVLDSVTVGPDGAVGLMAEGLPPNAVPETAESLVAPRLLELCFQTAGIWEVSSRERLALPSSLGRVRPLRDPSEAGGRRLWAVVTARGGGDSFDARVVDDEGAVYLDLEGYRTVALPGRVSLPGAPGGARA
jgi:NAD(P)-dependent dehydrogenase (short-subunit alcohol dehydrogenase family)